MVLKSVPFAVAVALLAWGGAARADDYKPSEYLGLDLSKAVLSPKRLGMGRAWPSFQREWNCRAGQLIERLSMSACGG